MNIAGIEEEGWVGRKAPSAEFFPKMVQGKLVAVQNKKALGESIDCDGERLAMWDMLLVINLLPFAGIFPGDAKWPKVLPD